ncbi:MAG: hypothetical protein WCA98_02885 [Candidatus Acidiferrales bacterium]
MTMSAVMAMMAAIVICAAMELTPASATKAHETLPQLAQHFAYDATPALDVEERGVRDRGGVKIHDIDYASPLGGRVPAYLVVPAEKGKFAAILWGHWMMPNSPSANRGEFLEEAIILAQAGVVSLMIDAPQVRQGFKLDADPLSSQAAEVTRQETVDLRRGLDVLLTRADVDAKRVAYVGHSFGAIAGAILDAVDKRPTAFVFMGNPVEVSDMLKSDLPQIVAFRKAVGGEKIQEYLTKYAWTDPGTYAAYFGPSPAFFQYATHDEFMTVPMEKHYFEMSTGPKEVQYYDATHSLNAQARRDRYDWLKKHIGLGELPAGALEKMPETQ